MLFFPECVPTGLPSSLSLLGIAAPAHLRARAAAGGGKGVSADSRFVVGLYGAIPGACSCVQGWDGMGLPDFQIARVVGLVSRLVGRQCSRFDCHDDRNRSMESRFI